MTELITRPMQQDQARLMPVPQDRARLAPDAAGLSLSRARCCRIELVPRQVKTTSPKKYCVRPNNGIVPPRSTFDVLVTMQAQREAPPDMQCRDKFLVQSAVVSQDIAPKDISGDMFTKESGNVVDEVKLQVVYAPPSKPTSINEGSDQESLGSWSYQETTRELSEPETIPSEPLALISKLMKEEKNFAIQENNKLREEL
ncbi:hypothetical protein D1007_16658 [Hordeum vulgare]|nr:hypothetical protein D1007_16658 [Hordeum vulgare]